MATQTTTNPSSNSTQLQTWFSRTLLKPLDYNLILSNLPGVVQQGVDVPGSSGATSIRFHKPRRANSSNVSTLTQGTPISTFTEVDFGYVDATLVQKGIAGRISDVLQAVSIFDMLKVNKDRLGADLAKSVDDDTRAAIVSGLLNIDSKFEQFASVPADSTGAQDGSDQFVDLGAKTNSQAKATRLEFLKAITTLRSNSVPQVPGGGYIVVTSPQALFDLRQDDAWLKAAQYSDADQLWKYRNYQIDGARFLDTDNPFIEAGTYGTYDSSGDIYSNFVCGAGAWGCPSIKGSNRAGGKAVAPVVAILDKPDKTDPANQYTVISMKIYWVAKLLKTDLSGDVPYVVNLRCKSTYNG